MAANELEPIDPRTALQMYLNDRKQTASGNTLRSHRSRLSHFITWCDSENIDNLNGLTGRDIHRYKQWRFHGDGASQGEYAVKTISTQMDTLRVFIRFVEGIDGVQQGISDLVKSPDVPAGTQRTNILPEERMRPILDFLDKHHYASLPHVLLSIMWRCQLRVGACHSLDVNDVQNDSNGAWLRVEHRPATDTTLKNGNDGERPVAIREDLHAVLQDYISHHRIDQTDEHGREPLFSSRQGRRHTTNLREIVYGWSRPCELSGECPHGKTVANCDAARRKNWASQCPSSEAPHAVRRGSITYLLREDTPVQIVSDRADVSPDVIDQHYDSRTEKEKMELRREYLPD